MRNPLTVSLKRLVPPSLALLAAIALLAPCAALATPFVIKLTQQGSKVVASGSGAFNLNGLTYYGSAGLASAMEPSVGAVVTGPGNSAAMDVYSGPSGATHFGSGGVTFSTTATGDTVAFDAADLGFPVLFVPQGYVSETALIGSATWDNASFASLGVTPGTYTWTWGTGADQSFTLEALTSVPEPAVLGMFGLGVLLIGGFVTLRRRKQRHV